MCDSHPISILYMEDDRVTARVVQQCLEQSGYRVTLARNGAEGLALYAAQRFDLLIVDQSMPICSGLDVIRRLVSRGRLPPIIMVTGSGDEKTAVEALKLGAMDYVIKDAEGGHLELLPTVIENVLKSFAERERLRSVEREAEKYSAIQNLSAGVAHNFNNLLTGVLGMAQFIRETLEQNALPTEDVDDLIGCAQRAASLSGQWLQWTRRSTDQRSEPSIGALVEELTERIQPLLPEGVRLFTEITAAGLPLELRIDGVLTGLMHVCTNALEAMPGGGALTIRTDADEQWTRIRITDSGVGMAPDILQHVFEPFFSTKDTVGVGLSLAFAWQTVMDEGGTMTVESTPGGGSTFTIALPIAVREG